MNGNETAKDSLISNGCNIIKAHQNLFPQNYEMPCGLLGQSKSSSAIGQGQRQDLHPTTHTQKSK